MTKDVQAKAITDRAALEAVRFLGAAYRADVEAALPGFPRKVVLAKLRALVRRGLLGADPLLRAFATTAAGLDLLSSPD